MGVTHLWQILAPAQQHRTLSSLKGQTLAVDLSIWVCETQSVKQMQGVVSKPFLRNLFFRISHLTQLGVKLVFVVEGKAPELKWEAMMKRQQLRFPGRQGKQSQHRQGRRNFNRCLKECCELLDILGIPYVQSQGEAEAMCALLNAAGLVDGCLTNDGDAFLYGARVVYRNFTMNTKDPHVESYKMSDIEEELGMDREGLVALGLLLGCDYVPKGVPGIGYANAIKLMETLRGRRVLKRLKEWRSMSPSDCLDKVEVLLRRKAVAVPDFPQEPVIKEFLVAKDRCPSMLPSWKRPIINRLQEFALDKLEWPVEYGLEKILPLVTLWDMQDILYSRHPCTSLHLKPHRIVKTRVRQGVPCYEVEWHKPASDTTCTDEYYVTIEETDLVDKCYKELKATLEVKKSKKPTKGTRKKKKEAEVQEDPCEGLSASFAQLNILNLKTDIKHVGTPFKVSSENFSNGERGQTSFGEGLSANFSKLNVHKSKIDLKHVGIPVKVSSENFSNGERGQTSFGEAPPASFSKLNVHTSKTVLQLVETPVISLENISNGERGQTSFGETPAASFAQLNVHNSKTDLKHARTPVVVLSESISNGERGQTSFGYPDFEIQTSLLNSLCCTLDHTTSPLHEEIKEHPDNVDIDTMAKGLLLDFKETSKLEVNSSSPIAEGINNTSDKLPVLTTSKFSALAENLEVVKTGNLGEVTEVLKTGNKAKPENLELAKTGNLGEVTEILKTGNKAKAENLEVAKTGNLGEVTEVLKTGNKAEAENLEVAKTGNLGEVSEVVKTGTMGKVSEVLKTGNMGKVSEVVKTGNSGENTKVQEPTKTTLYESKPRKGKSRKRGKKKTVKKVSAVMNFSHDDEDEENMMLSQVKNVKKVSADMDLSHDNEEDMMLSQRILSQKNVLIKNKAFCYEKLFARSVCGKENIAASLFHSDDERLGVKQDNKEPKVLSELPLNTETVNIEEPIKSPFKMLRNIDEETELETNGTSVSDINPIVISPDRTPLSSVWTDCNRLKESEMPSPVSLADRLRKKLKNSAAQKILSDFTKS